jgi:hypothetical protein
VPLSADLATSLRWKDPAVHPPAWAKIVYLCRSLRFDGRP